MALLDYLLGGAAGGFEGYERRKAKDLQAQKDEEERQIRQAQLYASLGMRAQPYRPASEEQVSVTPASSMDRAALTSALQRGMGVESSTKTMTGTDFQPTMAFQRSTQRGMGVEPTKADATMSPLQSAFQKATSGDLASSYIKRTAETPGIRQKLPGMDVVWQAGLTDEEKRTARLADLRAEKDLELEYQDKTINTERERMRGVYRGAYPTATEQQVEGMVNGIKPEDMGLEVLTPSQKRAQARQDSLDALEKRYKEAQIEKMQREGGATAGEMPRQDFSADLATISDFLPTTDPKTGKLIEPKRKLSGIKTLGVQEGGPSGSLGGKAILLGASMLGTDVSNEQTYNTIAQGIATAFAIAEQRGRNVSDKDVSNRIAQVVVQPNEVGNMEIQKIKGDRLRRWATAVSGGNVQQIQPGETGKLPVILQVTEQRKFNNNVPGNPFAGLSRPPLSSFERK